MTSFTISGGISPLRARRPMRPRRRPRPHGRSSLNLTPLASWLAGLLSFLGRRTKGYAERVTSEELRQAVEQQLGTRATFTYSAPVRHVFVDIVWEGTVHVFELLDHSSGREAYAWVSGIGPARRTHIVREGGGILGPAHAVRAVLMGDGNEPRF